MKKKFINLQPGDKVFEIFRDNTVGIYEIKEIHILSNNDIAIITNTIIGINRASINFNYNRTINGYFFYSYVYYSYVYSNEEDFLESLRKNNENI